MQTTIKKVMGLGSAKMGTEHFIKQRVTAIANLVLGIGFVAIILCSLGKNHTDIVNLIAYPPVSLILIGFTVSFCLHMQLGLRIIIEDYIHGKIIRILALLFTIAFSYTIMIASLYLIMRINYLSYS